MEGSLGGDMLDAWKWRPGGDALKSKRGAAAVDLADVPGWKHDYDPSSGQTQTGQGTPEDIKDLADNFAAVAVEA
jgi:hypothetical protein